LQIILTDKKHVLKLFFQKFFNDCV
jgi:hypothetical protein